MNVGFCGLGKLGLPCALAIESKGHNVKGFDISENVRKIIKEKKIPYKEAGAQDLLTYSNIECLELKDLVSFAEIIFVAVQTPHNPKYEGTTRIPEDRADFDYTYLKSATKNLSDEIARQGKDKIVVIISTCLPGTIEREIKPHLNKHVKLCYNPYFIAMGTCVYDFLNPEFILFGVDDPLAAKKAREFYGTIHDLVSVDFKDFNEQAYHNNDHRVPFAQMNIKEAELTKVAYNTYIGQKITFVNTMMEICHKMGGMNVDIITNCLKLGNVRLMNGRYLSGGMGDAGGCHPRDNIALSKLAKDLNLSYNWFDNVMMAREQQTEWLANLISAEISKHPSMDAVILGKAYKPESNLTIGSCAILLENILAEKGIMPLMYDPHVDVNDKQKYFQLTKKPHVFFIATRHPEFQKFNFPSGSVVIDPFRYIDNKIGIDLIQIGAQTALQK